MAVLATIAVLAGTVAVPACANRYHIVDLGIGPQPAQVNDAGAIAGSAYGLHALVYRGRAWHTLRDGVDTSYATGLNRFAQVVGVEQVAGVRDLAVIWQPDKRKQVLPLPRHGWNGYAQAISDSGLVAGSYSTPSTVESRCFLWTPQGRSIDLGLLAGGRTCAVHGVNVLGQVVGDAPVKPHGGPHAFRWSAGRLRDLGTLDGGSRASAESINDRGQVVGTSNVAADPNHWHAVLWQGGRVIDLSDTDDYSASDAQSINAKGAVVGYATDAHDGRFQAVRYEGGRVVRLADEVDAIDDWWLEFAYSVNDKGAIVGIGNRADGSHAYLLQPID